ncbi:MAG: PilZ domain-containing protein [Desulfohalobiaceae bacterium]|nr:PilZ domain-containing protein [Desulfohalobiaceae bacterium]
MNQSSSEHRRHKRQAIQALCFVRLSTDETGKQVVGSLADISAGGLGFTFLPDTTQPDQEPRPQKAYRLDLFQSGDPSFLLSDVPARLKYSIEKKDSLSFLGLPLKRCGLEFLDLTENQKEELKQLIEA